VAHAGRKITFVSVHPFTPIQDIKRRDSELRLIAERFTKKPADNLVLAGDFNATPYCHAYKKLVRALGLRNAREGYGIYPTWPAFYPTSLPRIPIDHVLVSAGIAVADFRTGPPIGGDHLPTITEIAMR
jgi:endonuclease/exonuclease/phosphatase (EEP) superfamily protein YafD